jgi:hypothetical protein
LERIAVPATCLPYLLLYLLVSRRVFMRRFFRMMIFVPLGVIACWYGMEFVHESG